MAIRGGLRFAGNDCRGCVGSRLLTLFFGELGGLLGLRILFDQLGGTQVKSWQVTDAGFDCLVVNGIGIQLPINPFGEAGLANAFDVARTGTVGETIEGVEDGFVGGKVGDRQAFENGILLWFFVFCGGSDCRVERRSGEQGEGEDCCHGGTRIQREAERTDVRNGL